MLKIQTLTEHKRLSTQELLLTIETAVLQGETEFQIVATGQHDIGGPLWNREGKTLTFYVKNPGQRVGAMCLPGTTVWVEGSAPADVGWLNSGGHIVVSGDVGDTAGHCAATGVIHIGGKAGVRTGSLMKHDPLYAEPALWVLRSVGDFSFEFMGGGKAVICGYDCPDNTPVLGDRPCVGMVGGIVYFRGAVGSLTEDVKVTTLDATDIDWLQSGFEDFLQSIGRPELQTELNDWQQWQKIVPLSYAERGHAPILSVADFHQKFWISDGIFSDVLEDSGEVISLATTGDKRLYLPVWSGENCRDCKLCLKSCPHKAIVRVEEVGHCVYNVNPNFCIGCGVCTAICPCQTWKIFEAVNA